MRCSLLLVLVMGCVSYSPAPLDPDAGERAFRERRLPRGEKWRFDALVRQALVWHPDLEVAKARVAVAEAGVRTAGARPNPTLGIGPEHVLNAGDPWILGFALDIPIETAGKRGLRIGAAERRVDVTRLELGEAAWKIRGRVRRAFIDHLLTLEELGLRREERRLRGESVDLLDRRLTLGEVSRPDVDSARIERSTTEIETVILEGRVRETRAALASAIGVSDAAMEDVVFGEIPALPEPAGEIKERIDLRRALAEYAAAEKSLELEIAKQYPDIRLAPGYSWDQADHKFALGLSIELPILNRNEGPIAEAEARRKRVAAEFLALQARAIGELETALARYRGARAVLAEAGKLNSLLENQEKVTERAAQLGQEDKLVLAGVRLQRASALRDRVTALRRAHEALADLEDAIQRPLEEK